MKAFHSERCVLIVDLKNDLIKSVLNQGKYFVISHFIRLLCPSNVTELDKEYKYNQIADLATPKVFSISLIGLLVQHLNWNSSHLWLTNWLNKETAFQSVLNVKLDVWKYGTMYKSASKEFC